MSAGQPILFLDLDDVIVLGRGAQFSGYDVVSPDAPPELWDNLFHPTARLALAEAVDEHDPRIVMTTSWLRFMDRAAFERLFTNAGMPALAERLHTEWAVPQAPGQTRVVAIDRWLAKHYRGEPYVILDDERSGVGLSGSVHDAHSRVVLCKAGVGLHRGHLPMIRIALSR
ncbi:MAG: HAD domain-containing protein [Pseudomonadota bacterium]|nr:HAD domain-containing protein [Pseudomonadota bacterium]